MAGITIVFRLAWLFIISVSVFDAYLVLHLREVIGYTERNPVGRALIEAADGGIWLFLLLKLFGTVLSCVILLIVFRSNWMLGLTFALAVAAFQMGLLIFLRFA